MDFGDWLSNTFSRDGGFTRFTEKIPVIGLVTATVQDIAGNGEYAKLTLAIKQTRS